MMDTAIVKVGMADLRVIRTDGILKTTGLGSCVGVAIYDPVTRIAGLAHIMLPSSDIARGPDLNIPKFADTAIPEMIRSMVNLGADVSHMEAKLTGGAQMFTFSSGDGLRIGPRNIEACRQLLYQYRIPIIGEDTGGNYGRTIELHSRTGELFIRSVHHGIRKL